MGRDLGRSIGGVQFRIVAPEELTTTDLAAWSACAAASLEPNPFFEPEWLLPAINQLDESPTTRLVIVEHEGVIHALTPVEQIFAGNDANPRSPGPLGAGHSGHADRGRPRDSAGDAPRWRRCCQLPAGRVAPGGAPGGGGPRHPGVGGSGWPHRTTSAARAGGARSTLSSNSTAGSGPCSVGGRATKGTAFAMSARTASAQIRQHRRRLNEAMGASPVIRSRTDLGAVDEFLRLEAWGWKGHESDGLALRRRDGTNAFFQTACRQFISEGRLWFSSLETDGRPIAMICMVKAGEGQFAFRTAYDEDLAKFGPGVEVFVDTMEQFERSTSVCWLDTCAAPGNQHLMDLFPDRHVMATLTLQVP